VWSAEALAAASAAHVALVTFAVGFVSGLVPVLNIEVYLLAAGVFVPRRLLAVVVAGAVAGHMCAKTLLYLAGRGILRLPLRRVEGRVDQLRERLARRASPR